eukprot:1154137-Pyramimonas_sp.AAC.1
MALQVQRGEGVQDGGGAGGTDDGNRDFMIVPVMLLLSWVFTYVLGFLTAIWVLWGRIAPTPQASRASSSSGWE